MSRRGEKRIRAEVGGNRAEARRIRRGRQLSSQSGQGHGEVVYQVPIKEEKRRQKAVVRATEETARTLAKRIGIILPSGVGDD